MHRFLLLALLVLGCSPLPPTSLVASPPVPLGEGLQIQGLALVSGQVLVLAADRLLVVRQGEVQTCSIPALGDAPGLSALGVPEILPWFIVTLVALLLWVALERRRFK